MSPAPKKVKAVSTTEPWQGIATQPFGLDMEVRITLFSSSSMIVVTDGIRPEPINMVSLDTSGDLLKVTERIDVMVDSLNVSVGRIATDRTQPAEERVRRIMIEQLRYREGIRQMIEEEVGRDSNTVVPPPQQEGASIETPKDDSLMNIDPSRYREELLPCPLTEDCTGIS